MIKCRTSSLAYILFNTHKKTPYHVSIQLVDAFFFGMLRIERSPSPMIVGDGLLFLMKRAFSGVMLFIVLQHECSESFQRQIDNLVDCENKAH